MARQPVDRPDAPEQESPYSICSVRAHLVQFDIAWENKPANHRAAGAMIASARTEEGDLVLLPEMFDTGFSLNVERTADEDGASASFLSEAAARHRVFVAASITVRHERSTARNRALVFAPDGTLAGQYDKMHPFSFGREGERFSRGEQPTTFEWRAPGGALRVCPTVCYDLRFPELFRRGLTMGAGAFVVVANWPAERSAHWRALLVARAIENQAFVFGVNRSGTDPHLRYAGGSIAVDPRGRVLGEAGDAPQVLSVGVEPAAVSDWRGAFPAWRDLHPGLRPSASNPSETGFSG
ncbi:MAG TPA: amidohydrolase [Phycisphaerales bacterium]|nr:amidohydrolase [Phycisphaerales bacterium]